MIHKTILLEFFFNYRKLGDKVLQEVLSKTLKLENVKQADYDAVFFPGGYRVFLIS
jgi:hypothetical protein